MKNNIATEAAKIAQEMSEETKDSLSFLDKLKQAGINYKTETMDFKDKVTKLRKQFPNNYDFGREVSRALNEPEKEITELLIDNIPYELEHGEKEPCKGCDLLTPKGCKVTDWGVRKCGIGLVYKQVKP